MGSEKATATKSESESTTHRRERSAQSFVHARDFPLRRLQQTLGNNGVQRLIQTKLQIGSSEDPSELEADQTAKRVLSENSPTQPLHGCKACGAEHKCQKCKQEEARLIQAKHTPSVTSKASTKNHSVSDSALKNLGPGRPLESSVRDFLEPRFGRDFEEVRLHDDDSTATMARSLNAQAFTSGSDLFFGKNGYQPWTSAGRLLLAHELTHVIQQSGRSTLIQRKVAVDVLRDSVTPAIAAEMTDQELQDQITLLKEQLPTFTANSPEFLGAKENLMILEEEVRRRSGPQKVTRGQASTPSSSSATPQSQVVPRPPGLPLDQGFTLQPLTGLSKDVTDAIPEGKLTVISPQALGAGGGEQPGPVTPLGIVSGGSLGAGTGLTTSLNLGLRATGLASAGENSIGLVGIPSWNPIRLFTKGIGPALPESTSLLGHTAVYVRIGNRIQVVRGLSPESFAKLATRFQAVTSGKAGTPAAFGEDAWLFTKTSARSVEWAVPQEVAEQLAADLPAPGSASGVQWTGRPSVFEAPPGTCGTNCVLFAVEEAEKTLGSRVAVVTPEGPIPITSLGTEGAVVPKTAGQGQFIRVLKDVQRGTAELAPAEEALGPAVVGGMSKGLQVLKWGGRVFIVVGVVAGVAEVATAPEGKKVRTAVGAGAGFVGGLALGATAGLVCGPGAPVCSVVLGLGFGIVGAVTARAAAEEIYDVATGEAQPASRPSGPFYPTPFFCFPGETRVVLADSSWTPISQLKVGDQVLAPLEDGSDPRNLAACEVINVAQHPPQRCLRIELATGIRLSVTPNHPLLATRGWTPAGELTSDDSLFCYGATDGLIPQRVMNIAMEPRPVPVYDITVRDRHTFLADGVVAHNKPP